MAVNRDTKLVLKVPTYLNSADKREVADRVIDFIKTRTRAGNSKSNKPWRGKAGEYTKAYAKVKGKKSPVDLDNSSAMLEAMRYFVGKNTPGEIVVGYTKGTKSERKAEGNIKGTYGQSSPIPGKARPFLDISNQDLKNILDDYTEEVLEEIKAGDRKIPTQKGKKAEGDVPTSFRTNIL
jgi:hypothetical protein